MELVYVNNVSHIPLWSCWVKTTFVLMHFSHVTDTATELKTMTLSLTLQKSCAQKKKGKKEIK